MSKERELLERLADSIETYLVEGDWYFPEMYLAEIRAELAKPEPTPSGYFDVYPSKRGGFSYIQINEEHADETTVRLYAEPQNQIPLTDSEIRKIYAGIPKFNSKDNIQILFARAIEKAHGIE